MGAYLKALPFSCRLRSLATTSQEPDVSCDEDELSASPAGSSGLLSGPANLKSTLTRVAQLAVQAIPNADGAGLSPIGRRRWSGPAGL